MLPEQLNNLYKNRLDQLESISKEGIFEQKIIPEIKTLLAEGANINTQNSNGNTLLHLAITPSAFKDHNQEMRASNNMDQVLDIPLIVSWFKPNPFIKDASGFTPSFLAAYYQDTPNHGMLLSYENTYQNQEISKAIYALSEMSVYGEYIQSNTGNRMHISNEQLPEYHKMRKIILNVYKKLSGDRQYGSN